VKRSTTTEGIAMHVFRTLPFMTVILFVLVGCGATSSSASQPVALCTFTNLKLIEVAGQPQGTSRGVQEDAFVNTGTSACTLEGYPTLTEVGPDGGTAVSTDSPGAGPAVAVQLGPNGGRASFFVVESNIELNDFCHPAGSGLPDTIRISPPGYSAFFTKPGLYCGDNLPVLSHVIAGTAAASSFR
jgi:hypothetical protein